MERNAQIGAGQEWDSAGSSSEHRPPRPPAEHRAQPTRGLFRSLKSYNYRLWSAGALVSNVGTWMQRIAQDWLVLTELTHHDAAAVGFVTALQFAPQLLLLAWTGSAADRCNRRKLLLTTQAVMGLLAAGLGLLTISGLVRAWHVYVFAFLLGCAAAFDAPARQTFVSEMVGERDLSNAVALNSANFNASRLIGPAVAGLIIAGVGSGWAFLINAASYVAVIASLLAMRTHELHKGDRALGGESRLRDGFRYVRSRPDLATLLIMVGLFGALGLNFPVFISSMAVSVFHLNARGFGLLTSAMAVGSVTGALLAARRERPRLAMIAASAGLFGTAYILAALMPGAILFGLMLTFVGLFSQTVTTSSMSLAQISTDQAMRGRVMALAMTLILGGQPLGAPLVGWIANMFGPRWALVVGAFGGFAAMGVGAAYLRRRNVRASPGVRVPERRESSPRSRP
jgi:MFS family permease